MPISLSTLEHDLSDVVDQVINTGKPVNIERNGHIVKLILGNIKGKLSNLEKHDCIVGDPDDLVDIKLNHHHSKEKL